MEELELRAWSSARSVQGMDVVRSMPCVAVLAVVVVCCGDMWPASDEVYLPI